MLAFRTEVCASAYARNGAHHWAAPGVMPACRVGSYRAPGIHVAGGVGGFSSRLVGAAGRIVMSLADLAAPFVASAAFRVAGRNGPAIILPAPFGRCAGTVEGFVGDLSRPHGTCFAVQPRLASRAKGSEQLGHIGDIENLARHCANPPQQRTPTERGR